MKARLVRSLCLVGAVSLLGTGCGKKALPRVTVAPVSGKVLINGQPAARAELTFYPKEEAQPGFAPVRPVATTDDQGVFRPSTYNAQDGLPPGDYAVTLRWPKITVELGEEVVGADRLAEKFSSPEKPAARVTIRPEPNELPPIDVKHP